jgi:hypothetical protein
MRDNKRNLFINKNLGFDSDGPGITDLRVGFNSDRTSPRGKGIRQAEAYLNKLCVGYFPYVFRGNVIVLTVTAHEIDDHR